MTLTAVGATTKTIPVTLIVTIATSSTGASFSISPPSLTHTAAVGSPNTTSSVTVTNTGIDRHLDRCNPLIRCHLGAGDTVTMVPGGSATITHTASTAGLPAGSYSGTATIAGGGITKQLSVIFTVVTSTAHAATLTWNANTETDLSGYKVYAGISSGHYAAPVVMIPKGTTYFFIVMTYDNVGNESLHSSEVSKRIF